MSIKNFDAKDVIVTVAGSVLTGLADGTFVNAARTNDSFATVTGADGEGARSQSNDKSGTITITLLQTSASNDILSAAHNLDELQGDGVFPVLIKDLNGTTLIQAETGYVQKPADAEFGREVGEREWIIATPNLQMLVGGALSV